VPTVSIINGPNLNRLGKREPEIYGTATLADIERMVRDAAQQLGYQANFFQSNHEGTLIDHIHKAADDRVDGIIINPGALSHYSYALADALRSVDIPAVEVHISDIYSREEWRRKTVTGEACIEVITGLGVEGYEAALKLLGKHWARSRRS
jgi:3-dehydroquinate dehydratase-2